MGFKRVVKLSTEYTKRPPHRVRDVNALSGLRLIRASIPAYQCHPKVWHEPTMKSILDRLVLLGYTVVYGGTTFILL